MTSDFKRTDQRQLRWLWIGLVVYFVFMLFALHYALTMPYPFFGLVGILNMAILFTFIFAIRRVYLRTQGQLDVEDSEMSDASSNSRREHDRRRLRWLWVGAVISFLTCFNASFYARQIPFQFSIGIATLYVGIATVFVLEIRRVSKRLRQ